MTQRTGTLLAFFFGIAAAALIFFSLKKCSATGKSERTDYYLLTNQITKMNKMVVLEQDFSSLQKTSVSQEILGNKISDNQIITFTKTNAQVSYDLNKMKMDVDTVNRKLIIKEMPQPQIRITPNVEIHSMDDSFFNRIGEDQIKKVTQNARQTAVKTVDENRLKAEGRKQLMQNINHIFVLAKALRYQIVDDTKTIDQANF